MLRKAFVDTLRDPAFVEDARKAKLDVEPIEGPKLAAIFATLYELPAPISSAAKRHRCAAELSVRPITQKAAGKSGDVSEATEFDTAMNTGEYIVLLDSHSTVIKATIVSGFDYVLFWFCVR